MLISNQIYYYINLQYYSKQFRFITSCVTQIFINVVFIFMYFGNKNHGFVTFIKKYKNIYFSSFYFKLRCQLNPFL